MSDDATNAAPEEAVSADIHPSTNLEDPSNWDFADPDDEDGATDEGQEPEEAIEEGETPDETPEEDPEQSSEDDDEADPEGSDEEQPDDEAEAAEPATLTLPSGDKVSLEEATAGYMRGADYTRKTQAVAESRKSVEAQAQTLQRTVDAFADFLSASITAEPDADLAYSDPQAYTAQKAMHDQQMMQVQRLMDMGKEPKAVSDTISQEAQAAHRSEEFAKIEAQFPQVKTPDGFKEFQETTFGVARELGFSSEELASAEDSRLFALAYWADKGMKAEKSRDVAKRKVAAAPKAAPRKQRTQPGQREAMKKLGRTGSIHDAMSVDFD